MQKGVNRHSDFTVRLLVHNENLGLPSAVSIYLGVSTTELILLLSNHAHNCSVGINLC